MMPRDHKKDVYRALGRPDLIQQLSNESGTNNDDTELTTEIAMNGPMGFSS